MAMFNSYVSNIECNYRDDHLIDADSWWSLIRLLDIWCISIYIYIYIYVFVWVIVVSNNHWPSWSNMNNHRQSASVLINHHQLGPSKIVGFPLWKPPYVSSSLASSMSHKTLDVAPLPLRPRWSHWWCLLQADPRFRHRAAHIHIQARVHLAAELCQHAYRKRLPIWVCLKMWLVPRKTQWFCWSLSLLNGYFIWGIPHFQTYPFVDDWFAIPTSKYSHAEASVAMFTTFTKSAVAMSLGAGPAPQREPSIQSCNGPKPMINAHFKPSLGVFWMTHFWLFLPSVDVRPKKLSKYGKCQKKTMVHQHSIQSSKLWAAHGGTLYRIHDNLRVSPAASSFHSTRNLSSTAVISSVSLAQPQL